MGRVNRSIKEYEKKLGELLEVARADVETAKRAVLLAETKVEALEGALKLAGKDLSRRRGRRKATDPEVADPNSQRKSLDKAIYEAWNPKDGQSSLGRKP